MRSMQSFFAVLGDLHAVTLGFQVEAQALSDVSFVFDDQDASHMRYTRGRRRVKVLPWPSPALSA